MSITFKTMCIFYGSKYRRAHQEYLLMQVLVGHQKSCYKFPQVVGNGIGKVVRPFTRRTRVFLRRFLRLYQEIMINTSGTRDDRPVPPKRLVGIAITDCGCCDQCLDLSSHFSQKMKFFLPVSTVAFWVCTNVSGFTIQTKSPVLASPLFMGRAAAVRAATKAKTDGRKAKINAIFGKRIIMAVKNGGGPDTDANTLLRDVIKQAKSNSVPVENIQRAIKRASEGAVGDFTESTFEACKSR